MCLQGESEVVRVHLELIGRDASRAAKRGDVTVIVDALRSSSTIITALSNGARGIIPACTLKEAIQLYENHPGALLAGERNMVKPPTFHMGNSPLEYTRNRVSGRTIILTTTDGTRAIKLASKGAKAVLIGAFLNASSVAHASYDLALKMEADISLIVVGKKGRFAIEDFLGAGFIIRRLPNVRRLIDSALIDDGALWAYYSAEIAEKNLKETIYQGEHAKKLKASGFHKDVEFCSRVDVFNSVPILEKSILVEYKIP